MSHDLQLGHTPEENAQRDAVHVAIIPVVAAANMRRGDRVKLLPDNQIVKAGSGRPDDAHGIIDPFLPKATVKAGDRVYMVLLPGKVTGMRHHWKCEEVDRIVGEQEPQPMKPSDEAVEEAERWLDMYAATLDSWFSARDIVRLFVLGNNSNSSKACDASITRYDQEFICLYGYDARGEIPAELFQHVRTLAAAWYPNETPYVPLNPEGPRYWTCSC